MILRISCFICISLLLIGFAFPSTQSFGQAKKPKTRTLVQPEAEREKTSEAAESRTIGKPKKVMVVDFDSRGVYRWWDGNWDIGSLFANSIVGPLSRTEGYEVVERERMNAIFAEQGLLQSERFNQSAVTKIGRLLGADLILFGYLTDFSRQTKNRIVYREVFANVNFSARLVDVATGKIMKSAEISYQSPREKEVLLANNQQFKPNDPEFLQSLFGKAITESSKKAIEQLTGEKVSGTAAQTDTSNQSNKNDDSGSSNSTDSALTAIVADVSGKEIIINRGSDHGVREGQAFAVLKVVREVKDPKTGKVILKKTEEVARLKITSVEKEASIGTLVSGAVDALNVGTEVERINQ